MGAKNSRRLSRAGGLKKIDYDKQNKIIPRPFDEDGAKVLHSPELGKDYTCHKRRSISKEMLLLFLSNVYIINLTYYNSKYKSAKP